MLEDYISFGFKTQRWIEQKVVKKIDQHYPSAWKGIWIFYFLLSAIVLGCCLIEGDDNAECMISSIPVLNRTFDAHHDDEWMHNIKEPTPKGDDPCWGYQASINSCIADIESKIVRYYPIEKGCEWEKIFDLFGSENNLKFLFHTIGLDHTYFTLYQIFESVEGLEQCSKGDDLLGGLCEEQIAASKIYAILHKICGYDSQQYLSLGE